MNVRPSSDLPQAAPIDGVRADRAQAAPSRPGTAPAAPAAASDAGDRVELSAQALARADQGEAQSPEVEAARVALRAGGGLGDARLHELRERVRTGHYDQPDVVDRVAGAAARDLGRAE